MIHLILAPFTSFRTPHLGVATLGAVLRAGGFEARVHDWNTRLARQLIPDLPGFSPGAWAERDPHHPGQLLISLLLFPDHHRAEPSYRAAVEALWDLDLGALASSYGPRFERWFDELEPQPGDWIGLTLYQSQLPFVLYAARSFKRRWPHVRIVLGGYACHPDLLAPFLRAFPWFDAVVYGEGEKALPELLGRSGPDRQGVGRGVPSTMVKTEDGALELNPAMEPLTPGELDALPPPDFSWVDGRALQDETIELPVLGSRGCPHGACRYCSDTLYWPRYRQRSVQRIVQEIEHHFRTTGCRRYKFLDLALNTSERRIQELCSGIAQTGLELSLWGLFRPAPFSRSMARRLKQAGFTRLQFGVEALDTALLERMGKQTTLRDGLACIGICNEEGITCSTNLIAGFPGQTLEEVTRSYESLKRSRGLFAGGAVLRIYPYVLRWGSWTFEHQAELGISAIEPSLPAYLFPPQARESLPLMEFWCATDSPDGPLIEVTWRKIGGLVDELAARTDGPCLVDPGERRGSGAEVVERGWQSGFPALYARWLDDLLEGPLPEEKAATCGDCAMCPPAGAVVGDDRYFNPQTKCCTFFPFLPNFLVGGALADTLERTPARQLLLQRVQTGDAASPLGLGKPAFYEAQYHQAPFGQERSLRCPYYLEQDQGRCGIWAHRKSICATWFCKHDRGATGRRFWRALYDLLAAIEQALSIWCVLRLDPDLPALEQVPPHVVAGSLHAPGGAQASSWLSPARIRDPWGSWAGRQEAFYRRCGDLVAELDWPAVSRLAGPRVALQARRSQKTYQDLDDTACPAALEVQPFQVLATSSQAVRVAAYSSFDPLELPRSVHDQLFQFDGRPVKQALESISSETGLEVELDLLRLLVDFEILLPPG